MHFLFVSNNQATATKRNDSGEMNSVMHKTRPPRPQETTTARESKTKIINWSAPVRTGEGTSPATNSVLHDLSSMLQVLLLLLLLLFFG